jgi:cation transport ATPase
MQTTTFTIVGMHCASCVARNEHSLKNIAGVKDAIVNFATHSATVEYDPALVSADKLYEAIVKNGYQVVTKEDAQRRKDTAKQELRRARDTAAVALLLSVPVMASAMFHW